ncbi:MAG: phospholipase C, phosphocholine-specific [Bryobacteraceae bacterium]
MASNTRRSFLRKAAAGAALSQFPGLSALLNAQAAGPNLSSVSHVVVFCQENRAFDHYLGTISGARGYGDPHTQRLPNGDPVFAQRSSSGTLIEPFRLNSFTTSGQCVSDVNHLWNSSLGAVNGGRMDQWIPKKGNNTMGYYTRADNPYLYGVADAFTLCDSYHCSFNGPTNPNRLYLMTGMIDPNGVNGGPATNNNEPGFTWTTYPERLQNAGVSWRVYEETDNYDDNALAWFTSFRNAAPDSPLYLNGMQRFPRTQFSSDVQNNTLPAVSWVIAPQALSEHPNNAPDAGMNYGAQYYLAALAANPTVWQSTVFIWTYDENGGFFDHIAPPTPPPGTPDEFVTGSAIGMGNRVPTILISPWSRGGWICGEVFDHTSILRFLEVWTGVKETNISAWRRKVSGDLTSAFDFSSPNTIFPSLPDPVGPANLAATNCAALPAAKPNGETAPPAQEAGTKPLRALPYQLSHTFQVQAALRQVVVMARNDGSRGCAVHLHHFANGDAAPVHLTLAAGAFQTRSLLVQASNAYDVELFGPGGFYRRSAGDIGVTEPEIAATVNTTTAMVQLTLTNASAADIAVQVTTPMSGLLSYQQTVPVAANSSVQVWLGTVSAWYDYSCGLTAGGPWLRKFAGHIEGLASTTRPA